MDVSAHIDGMASDALGLEGLIPEWTRDACEAHADELAQMNRDRLMAGLSHEGYPIFPDYSPYTIAYKRKRGGITDRVTLYDYGAFHASLHVVFGGEGFHVESSDSDAGKVTFLEDHYGNQIYGFTEDDRDLISVVFVGDEVAVKVHDYVKR